MTNITALDVLIEAVESGRDIFPSDFPSGFRGIPWAIRAHEGSLDAAKALHDALLPGWDYRNGRDGDDYHALVFRSGRMDEYADDWQMCPNSPARAWLVATIKTYRSTRL